MKDGCAIMNEGRDWRKDPLKAGDTVGSIYVIERNDKVRRVFIRHACCGAEVWMDVSSVYAKAKKAQKLCKECAKVQQGIRQRGRKITQALREEDIIEQGPRIEGIERIGCHDWWPLNWRLTDTRGRHETPGYRPIAPPTTDSPLAAALGTWTFAGHRDTRDMRRFR